MGLEGKSAISFSDAEIIYLKKSAHRKIGYGGF